MATAKKATTRTNKPQKTDRTKTKMPEKGASRKTSRQPKGTVNTAEKPDSPKETATIDQRRGDDRRSRTDRRQKAEPVAVERRSIERRKKVNRRRQIDPTTCERDYTVEEVEFMNALDEYKRTSGRMFPTCSEVLEVLRGLGYTKRTDEESAPDVDDKATTPASAGARSGD